jgi:hypothetical protein
LFVLCILKNQETQQAGSGLGDEPGIHSLDLRICKKLVLVCVLYVELIKIWFKKLVSYGSLFHKVSVTQKSGSRKYDSLIITSV